MTSGISHGRTLEPGTGNIFAIEANTSLSLESVNIEY